MIFLTVGTQLPFDRFVEIVDQWAAKNPEFEIFGQIGEGDYKPLHIKYCAFLDEQSYKQQFDKANIVLAHAAMGSIITSLIESKPVVVFRAKRRWENTVMNINWQPVKTLQSLKGATLPTKKISY